MCSFLPTRFDYRSVPPAARASQTDCFRVTTIQQTSEQPPCQRRRSVPFLSRQALTRKTLGHHFRFPGPVPIFSGQETYLTLEAGPFLYLGLRRSSCVVRPHAVTAAVGLYESGYKLNHPMVFTMRLAQWDVQPGLFVEYQFLNRYKGIERYLRLIVLL
jgi:hypothetical protein